MERYGNETNASEFLDLLIDGKFLPEKIAAVSDQGMFLLMKVEQDVTMVSMIEDIKTILVSETISPFLDLDRDSLKVPLAIFLQCLKNRIHSKPVVGIEVVVFICTHKTRKFLARSWTKSISPEEVLSEINAAYHILDLDPRVAIGTIAFPLDQERRSLVVLVDFSVSQNLLDLVRVALLIFKLLRTRLLGSP